MNRTTPRRERSFDNPRISPQGDLNLYQHRLVESPFRERLQPLDEVSSPAHNEPGSIESDLHHIQPRNLFGIYDPTRPTTREDRLRVLRQDALQHSLPATSSFIGEKLMVTTNDMNDSYYVALAYYQQGQHDRALEILNKRLTLNKSVPCRYLAGLCSLALENGHDALAYLGDTNPFSGKDIFQEDTQEGCIKLESVMCFARGKAYMLLKDIDKARDCFKESLSIDIRCYDALDALVRYSMLDEKDEKQFIMTLPYEEHCGTDAEYFRYLYGLKLKNVTVSNRRLQAQELEKSLDVLFRQAEDLFTDSHFEECLKACKQIQSHDRYFKESIPVYLSCLSELGMKSELYFYAQELVDTMNDDAVAWHAVGLYYLCTKKNMEARRYFHQALSINQFFQQSWLGYGHSFSAEKDHEQAINAYMTCSKLIPGSYLPLMHIAMQYMEQNKIDEAEHYFSQSYEKNNHDPFLLNEMAVYFYKVNQYQQAHALLHRALKLSKQTQSQRSAIWEKLWCNLGHVYRHPPLYNLERALQCFQNALIRNPKNSDARAAVGMIYQLNGNTARAIVEFHAALDQTEAGELINELLETSLSCNFKTPYARDGPPKDDDSFDLFTKADSSRNARDEVDRELMGEDETDNDALFNVQTALLTRNNLEPQEDLIIDEGDFKPMTTNKARDWRI